jgi:BirA family biotin operon repressor/biotin-[acetyl-CoA-carboxylase] ligase
MDQTQLRNALSLTPVSEIQVFESVGSTNDVALAWADSGAPDFSLVLTDQQPMGRGRFNRRWVTEPGSSLAFSVILKSNEQERSQLSLFSPLCGLAVREAVFSLLGLESEIKWPNDILLNRKKCAGILVEAAWMGDVLNGVILGIGVNISSSSIPPGDDLLFPATSLENELDQPVDRFSVLSAILRSIGKWRPQIGSKRFFKEWQDHLAFKGEIVKIEHSEKPSIIGVVKGIDETGKLVLIVDNKEEVHFEVGDVHLRPANSSSNGGYDA